MFASDGGNFSTKLAQLIEFFLVYYNNTPIWEGIMWTYALSFRIHEDDTAYVRRNSLVDIVKASAIGGQVWGETTSFLLFKSNLNISDLMSQIYGRSTVIDTKDLLVLIDVTKDPIVARGVKHPATLAGFFA